MIRASLRSEDDMPPARYPIPIDTEVDFCLLGNSAAFIAAN
jgi:hypothetical protein